MTEQLLQTIQAEIIRQANESYFGPVIGFDDWMIEGWLDLRQLADALSASALKAAHAELNRQFQTSPDAGYYRRVTDDTAHLDGSFDIRRLVEAIINGDTA